MLAHVLLQKALQLLPHAPPSPCALLSSAVAHQYYHCQSWHISNCKVWTPRLDTVSFWHLLRTGMSHRSLTLTSLNCRHGDHRSWQWVLICFWPGFFVCDTQKLSASGKSGLKSYCPNSLDGLNAEGRIYVRETIKNKLNKDEEEF